jgi:3'-phosphoadenosine 5'-phosphosulfate (PAPS) 3'-phosphatase
MRKSELLDQIKDIAIAASEVILTYYLTAPIEVITKNDDSPLTKAEVDLLSNLNGYQALMQRQK